jgi:hypothetical protein
LCQEFLSQALVPFEESQIPSFIADSQPPIASKVVDVVVGQCSDQPQFAPIRLSQSTVQSIVQSVASKVALNIAKAKMDKELSEAAPAHKTA